MDAPENPRDLLARSLVQGRLIIGEVLLAQDYSLRHVEDAALQDLTLYTDPIAARDIARYDNQGNFRPLKSAPNLRRGWLLQTGSLQGMELALEFLYPAALGLWFSSIKETLFPTPLRETLNRQTGMYRVTQLLKENQADELIGCRCSSSEGCLRTILWEISPGVPIRSLPPTKLSFSKDDDVHIPLICREACHLLIAAARPIAKGNLPNPQDV
jgi:sirohydrochlorin cobaltochelatase